MTQPSRILPLSLAVALVAVGLAGCGSGGPLNTDAGTDVPGDGGNTGAGGSGSPGTGGATGSTGGVTGGTGGVVGGTGGVTAGTGGAVAGTGGAGGRGAGGRVGGAGGRMGTGGAGGRAPACTVGDTCATGFSCDIPCRVGGRVGSIGCFCSPTNVLACATCVSTPIPACGSTVVNGQGCTVATDPPCDTACVNGVSAQCTCTPALGGPVWRCPQNPGVCM